MIIMSSSSKTFWPSRLHTAFFLLVLLTHRNSSHNNGREQQQCFWYGSGSSSSWSWWPSSSSSVGLANAAPKRRKDGNALSRNISVHNKAAALIDLFWIHPTTEELAPSNTNGDGVVFGAMTGVLSYVSHRFEVREIPNPTTGQCKYAECRKAYFTCSGEENQEIDIVTDPQNPAGNFLVKIDDDKLKAEREAMRALAPCQDKVANIADPQQKLTALAACWKTQTDDKLAATQDEIAFQKAVRNQLGAKLQEYKCDADYDETLNVTTSASLFNSTYFAPTNKQVELLFESDFSSVRLYRDFLTPTECKAITIGQSLAASDSALQKIRRLASEILLRDPYKTSTKSIRWRIDNGDSTKADDGTQECTVQADGSCLANDNDATSTRKSSSSAASSSLMRVTQTDPSVDARLFVTCTSGGSATVKGGVLFYPKAGVQIVPVSGEAVVTIYQDHRGRRDDDPFVDDHIVCPVQTGVVVTLEDTYYAVTAH